MLICPNKNLKEWKDLVASVGENRAMLMWYESEGKVGFTLSAQTTILDNLSKVNNWFKQMKDTDAFWNKLQKDLQIPKEQISLLKESNGKTIEEKLTNFVVNYSYTIEINTAKTKEKNIEESRDGVNFNIDGDIYRSEFTGELDFDEFGGSPVIKYTKNGEVITEEEFLKQRDKATNKPSKYYSNLTVPGGINYTENEISTPLITPSIKGHAQFATDNGIGWFRSDDQTEGGELVEWDDDKNQRTVQESRGGIPTKTRRILELQSDLFQKGRDKKQLFEANKLLTPKEGEEIRVIKDNFYTKTLGKYRLEAFDKEKGTAKYGIGDFVFNTEEEANAFLKNAQNPKENQFLQLLNKDNNWVTFFIKSIIQDSAKKGYENVLFPSGDTASKIEGHQTLADELKRIDEKINKETDRVKKPILERFNSINEKILNLQNKNVTDKYEHTYISNKYKGLSINGIIVYKVHKENKGLVYTNIRTGESVSTEFSQLSQLANELNIKDFGEGIRKEDKELRLNSLLEEKKKINKELEDADIYLEDGLQYDIQRRNQLKSEGIAKLKPIYNFYENTVTNILNKTYGKDNVKVVTDEYGNTWNEVELLDDLLENFTIGTFKPRIPIPIPINNSLEELYREDVENSNNTCTFDIGK